MLSRRSIRNFMGLSGLEFCKSEEVSKEEMMMRLRGGRLVYFFNLGPFDE